MKNESNFEGWKHGSKPHAVFRPVNRIIGLPSPCSILSDKAFRLINNLCSQCNGINNGALSASLSTMRLYGWTSKRALQEALIELLGRGWIEITRNPKGQSETLYAVTFMSIDHCEKYRLDVMPTDEPSHLWKKENQYLIELKHTAAWEKLKTKRPKSEASLAKKSAQILCEPHSTELASNVKLTDEQI